MRPGLLLALAACAPTTPDDALAPGVDACAGGGGRVEALGALGVTVDGVDVGPWRAEVLVRPVDDRVVVETFACVLDDAGQAATWAVDLHLPERVVTPLDLFPGTAPAADGLSGTIRRGDAAVSLVGEGGSARITTFDVGRSRLVGTLSGTWPDDAAPERLLAIDARFDLAW